MLSPCADAGLPDHCRVAAAELGSLVVEAAHSMVVVVLVEEVGILDAFESFRGGLG